MAKICRMKAELKIDRGLFTFIIVVVNASNAYLVPQIPIPYLAAFTSVVLNGVIGYLSFEMKEMPEEKVSSKGEPKSGVVEEL